MDLRHVRTFVTVAEEGTVSKAALRLRIAQPALSRQIKDLEGELGITLFDRLRGRLVLTAAGERLLAECRNIIMSVTSLREQAEILRRPDAGVLKIGATPQMIDGIFSTFLHRYAARFPKVQIKVSEAVGPDLFAKLERGELHLGIGSVHAAQPGHGFASFPLPPVEFLAASHASQQLGSGGKIEIGDLAGYPLLLLETSFAVRNTFDAACRLAGISPEIFIESRTPHTLLAFAEAGHGVAIVPSVLPTRRYRLCIARVMHRRRPLRLPLSILWDSRRMLPQYARDFCGFIAAYMREVYPISQPPRTALRAGARNRTRRKRGATAPAISKT